MLRDLAGARVQFQTRRRLGRPRIFLKIRSCDFFALISQKIEKRGDIERVTNRRIWREVFFREQEESYRGFQSAAVFRMCRMFEIFLEMHKCARNLD